MNTLKRISLIFVAIMILIIPVSVNCFAVDPVSFTEATTLGATIVDLYGAVNNTSLAYDAIQPNGALTEIVTLYQNYSSSASDPYTLAAIGAAAAAAGAIAVVYDAVTGQGYVQLYQEQYISSLDGYWDYQLADAGLIRSNSYYHWTASNNVVDPIRILALNGIFWDQPISYDSSYPTQIGYDVSSRAVSIYADNDGIYTYVFLQNGNYYSGYARLSDNPITVHYKFGNFSFARSTSTYVDGIRSGYSSYAAIDVNNTFVPVFQSQSEALAALKDQTNFEPNNAGIDIEPSTYIGDPLLNPLEITIPDVIDPNYIPQPRRIDTNIPWNPEWGNPLPDGSFVPEYGVPYTVTDPSILNNAVPGIWDYIVSNPIEIEDAQVNPDHDPDPGPDNSTEVYTPFLPVTLPSFNFSFSGIWHYVREWVASISAWFTMVFEVWSHLPYAIVVPVFATAVIVIVLGVYKRFFM